MPRNLEELVDEIFRAFNAREVAAVLALCDPQVEFLPVTATLAGGGLPYRGYDGIERYFEDVARWWEQLQLAPRDYRRLGDESMLVLGSVQARRRGVDSASSAGWIWRFRGGMLISGRVYASAEEAIAAAG